MTQDESRDSASADHRVGPEHQYDERGSHQPTPIRPSMVGRAMAIIGGVIAILGGVLVLVGLLVEIARFLFEYQPLIAIGLVVLLGGAILFGAGELVRRTIGADHEFEW